MNEVILSKDEALKALGVTGDQMFPKGETLSASRSQILSREQALKTLDNVDWAAARQKTADNLHNIAEIRKTAAKPLLNKQSENTQRLNSMADRSNISLTSGQEISSPSLGVITDADTYDSVEDRVKAERYAIMQERQGKTVPAAVGALENTSIAPQVQSIVDKGDSVTNEDIETLREMRDVLAASMPDNSTVEGDYWERMRNGTLDGRTPEDQKTLVQIDALNKIINTAKQRSEATGERPTTSERIGAGVKAIGDSTEATLPMLGEAAKQVGKDTIQNFSNPEFRAALWDRIKKGMDTAAIKRLKDATVSNPVSLDTNAVAKMRSSGENRERMLEGLTPEQKFVGEGLYSVADNATTLPLAAINPSLPLYAMGTKAAAGRTYELTEQRKNAGEALTRGVVSGVIEGVTEKVPLNSMLDIIKTGGKDYAANLLKQTIIESGEEGLSYVMNYMADKAAKDPNAKFSVEELFHQMALGGFSGSFMAGSGTIVNRAANVDMSSKLGDGKATQNTTPVTNVTQQPSTAEAANKPTLSSSNPTVQHLLEMRDNQNARQENLPSGIYQNEASGRVSRRVRRAMDAASKKLGVSIVMDETLHGDNGHYDPKTKSIHIAMDAADPLRVVFTHEVTHRLKETSPQLYGEFKESAFKIMEDAGTLDTVKAAVSKAYSDPAVMDDEVLAHFTRRMTEDIGEFEKLVGVNRNLAQKIFDMLDDIIRKAKVNWNGLGVSSQNDDALFGDLSPQQLETVRDHWRGALETANTQVPESGNISKMVRLDATGNPYVEISDDILDGVSQSDMAKTVNQYLQTHDINVNGRTVAVNAATRNEYHHSRYTGIIKANEPQMYRDKMRAAKEIDEIVQTSGNTVEESLKHARRDSFKSFKRSKVTMQVGQNEYNADVVVGVSSSGKEVLYDVVNITPTTIKKPSRQILMPQKATSSPEVGTVLSTNIPQEGNGVNNYSMQQNAKNSSEMQSKKLDAKKYSDMQKAGVDMKAVLRENETLRKMNEALKAQFELTKPGTHDKGSIKGIARSLLKNWAGTMNADTLTDRLQGIYDGVAQGKMKWDSLRSEADGLARELLEDAEVRTNNSGYSDAEIAEIKASLRNVKKTISKADRESLGETYSEFRRRNFGRIGLVNEGGLPIDTAYSELSRMYPALFSENVTHPADQLKRMEKISRSIDWNSENPYKYDIDSFSRQLGDEIIDSFWNAKTAKPTFADTLTKSANLKQAKLSEDIERLKEKLVQTKGDAQRRVEKMQANQRAMKQNEATRREQSQNRQQLLTAARRFERLLNKTSPDIKKKITETSEFSEYMNIIKDIDTQGVSILKNGYLTKDGKLVRGEADLRALSEAYNDAIEENPDFLRNPRIEKDILRLDKKQIYDMTIEDVDTLINVIQAATHEIQTSNELLDTEKRIEVYRAREQMVSELEQAKKKRSTAGFKKGLETLYGISSLRPKTFFERISGFKDDGVTMRLYNALEGGQTKMLDFQRKALQPFDDFAQEHSSEMRTWTGENAEVIDTLIRTSNGKKVQITPMMRIALALHATNDQNLAHIKDGGLTIPDIELLKKGKIEEAYANSVTIKMLPSQVRTIAAGMNQSERAFFELAQKYFNETSKQALNETSVKLLGYEIAKVDNYFPIKTDKNFGYSDFESLLRDGRIEGLGMLHERINAKNPIMMISADAVITQQISDISKYYGMAIPLRNLTKVWSGGLMGYENSVKKQMQNSIGPEGMKYVEKLMKDIQSPKRSSDFTAGLRGNFAAAVLNANPSVALSQAASYPTAAAELGYKALAEGLVNGKVNTNLIAKYTPLLWYRSLGYMNSDLADMKSANRLAQKLPGSKWIQGADLFTVGRLWKASEAWTKNSTDLKPGTDEFYKKVAEKFNRVVYDTQPNYTTLQRPDLLRSDSELAKSVMMFSTQRMQNYNMMYEAAQRVQAAKEAYAQNKTPANKKAFLNAKKGIVNNAAALLVANAVYTAMKAAAAGLVDRDKDYKTETGGHTAQSILNGYFTNYAKNMSGSVAFGTELMEAAEAVLTDGHMYDVEVPQIALISDLVGGGAKLANNLKSMVEEMADTKSTVWQYMSKNPDKILGNTRRFALSLSKATGVPVENWEKYITGILGQVHPAIKTRYDNVYKLKTVGDISAVKDSRKYRATFDTVLENNVGEISQELSDELFSLYGEAGKQAIPSAMPKTISGLEISPKQYSKAKSKYEKLANKALLELTASRMYDKKNAEAKTKLISMTSGLAKDMAVKEAMGTDKLSKWESAAVDYGDSKMLAAFVMAQFAYENETPADKNNGKTVSGSKKEKFRKYLNQLDLTARQREYIFKYYYPKG